MKIFLFQGDSITDAGRNRENNHFRGSGYPTIVSGKLGFEHPGEYQFINKGISGDRVVDIYARMKKDITELHPDYLSILVGVNDVWHELYEVPNGVDNDKYFKVYCDLIAEVMYKCPGCKIFLLEPFVLKSSATEGAWDYFKREVALRAESAKKVAEKYGLTFVPLQEKFDAAAERAPASYWLLDGVHPSAMWHTLIANELCAAFEKVTK